MIGSPPSAPMSFEELSATAAAFAVLDELMLAEILDVDVRTASKYWDCEEQVPPILAEKFRQHARDYIDSMETGTLFDNLERLDSPLIDYVIYGGRTSNVDDFEGIFDWAEEFVYDVADKNGLYSTGQAWETGPLLTKAKLCNWLRRERDIPFYLDIESVGPIVDKNVFARFKLSS